MNKNHDIIEQELRNLSQQITVPSRGAFKPIFDRVTNKDFTRSPYQTFLGGLFRHKALVLSIATSLAVVAMVIIPSLQSGYEVLSVQSEAVIAESDQEVFLIEQEDAAIGGVIEQYLGQLEQFGEQEL